MDPIPSRALLVQAAGIIARQIRAEAVEVEGGLTWLRAPAPDRPAEPLDPWLYTGAAGVALFLAALERLRGDGEHRDLCRHALEPVRRRLAEPDRELEEAGIGGMIGLGSLVWTFLRIGELLGEPALIQEAHDLSSRITPQRIAGDRDLEVVLGSAGALLALLALDRTNPLPNRAGATPLELASACGRHLLARRVSPGGGPRAWPALGQPPASGFSHGAAGICHALLRLHERTGERELCEAAQEGLAFERGLYLPERKNWRDAASAPGDAPMTTWCHGAPGIALGRLGTLGVAGGPEVREEIRAALETTRSLPQTSIDHLCCGNLGRAEILLYASRKLGEPQLQEAAGALATGVLRRFKARGRFGLALPERDEAFDPSFFKGLSGIGYALLRLADPSALPCPLLLE